MDNLKSFFDRETVRRNLCRLLADRLALEGITSTKKAAFFLGCTHKYAHTILFRKTNISHLGVRNLCACADHIGMRVSINELLRPVADVRNRNA